MRLKLKHLLLSLLLFAAGAINAIAQDIHEWTDKAGITWSFTIWTQGEGEEQVSFASINASTLCTGEVTVPESVYVDETPYPVKRIDNPAEGKSVFGPDVTSIDLNLVETVGTEYNQFFGCTSLQTVNASNLTSIGNGCFNDSPVQFVYLSSKCTSIGGNAFGSTSRLENIGDLSGVTFIGDGAFCGSHLSEINIPACTHIGANAFTGSNIQSIQLGTTIPEFDKDDNNNDITPFNDVNTNGVKLIVPEEQKAAYQAANIWKYFNYSDAAVYRNKENDLTWIFTLNNDKAEATILGTTNIAGGTVNVPGQLNYEVRNGDDITYPSVTVTAIGKRAFANYTLLERINLPATVKSIGTDAFAGDEQLRAVKITNTTEVVDIADGGITTWMRGSTIFGVPQNMVAAYTADANWKDMTFFVEGQDMTWTDQNNITWTFETNSFDEAVNEGYRATVYGSATCPETVSVPQNVYVAGKPYPVKRLAKREGFRLFGDDTKNVNLEDVEDCDSWSQFVGNPQIETVTALNLTSVADALFFDTELKQLTLSEKCKRLNDRSLGGTKITTINIAGCESLGCYVFSGCKDLTDVYIGDVIRQFGVDDGVFKSPFDGLNTHTINLHLPESANEDDYRSADVWGNFHYLSDGGVVKKYTDALGAVWGYTVNEDGETATLCGHSTTTLTGAWAENAEIETYGDKELPLPSKVVDNGNELTVTVIGKSALSNLTTLEMLIIPSTVTRIEDYAFYDDNALTHIFIENPDLITLSEHALDVVNGRDLKILVVLPEAYDKYKDADGWKDFNLCVGGGTFDYTDDNGVTWTFESMATAKWYNYYKVECLGHEFQARLVDMKNNGTEVVVPEKVKFGDIEYDVYCINGDNSNAPDLVSGREPFAYKNTITKVTLPTTVKEIDWGAFRGCTSLTEINLEDVEKLHDWAFSNCDLRDVDAQNAEFINCGVFADNVNLAKAKISAKCKVINNSAFSSCQSLAIIEGDASGVECIGSNAFQNTPQLKSILCSSALKQIGERAFENSGIETVGSTSGVVSIGWGAFRSSKIKKVDLSNCTILDEWVFDSCNDLEEVGSVAHLLSLGNGVFWDCTKLSSLDLSNKCTYLGHRAVAGCPNLTTVGDLTGCDYIESYAFDGDTNLQEINIPTASHIGEYAFLNCGATVNYRNGNKFVPENDPDYSLYVDDIQLTNTSIIIPLKLRTQGDVCAFQSDIFLPEGADKKATSFGINSDRIDPNAQTMASYSNGENGRIRSMAMSIPSLPFVGEDGVIATLVLDLGVNTGNYSPTITNIVLATTEGKSVYVGANNFTLDVDEAGTKGDLNGDGAINAADVIALSNLIMQGGAVVTSTNDINGDGVLNILDVTAMINQILHQGE